MTTPQRLLGQQRLTRMLDRPELQEVPPLPRHKIVQIIARMAIQWVRENRAGKPSEREHD